jgi:hypothetical protein
VKDAFRSEQDAGAVFRKDLVCSLGEINIHFILKTRAAALDDFYAKPLSLFCSYEKRLVVSAARSLMVVSPAMLAALLWRNLPTTGSCRCRRRCTPNQPFLVHDFVLNS